MSKKKKEVEILIVGEENSGVIIDGEICMPDDIVTVSVSDARNLIHRERAILYTEEVEKADAARIEAFKEEVREMTEEAKNGKEK